MSKDYTSKVFGKLGNIDLVATTGGEDFVVNKWGAKVYTSDPSKHDLLEIPQIDTESNGKTYQVQSVGFVQTTPIVTIMEGGEAKAYRLPIEYSEWAMHIVGVAHGGMNMFPSEVEFGYNIHQQRYYAEIL